MTRAPTASLLLAFLGGAACTPEPVELEVRVIDDLTQDDVLSARFLVDGRPALTEPADDGTYHLTVDPGRHVIEANVGGYFRTRQTITSTRQSAEVRVWPSAPTNAEVDRTLRRRQAARRRDDPDDPGDLRPEVRAFLNGETEEVLAVSARAHESLDGGVGRASAGLTELPATIRVWRASLDGSTSSCAGRVDVIALEDYVAGVVPHEWIPSWQPASLRAGAIAARTYATYWIRRGGKYGCADLSDDTRSQVYRDDRVAVTDLAVEATASQVVTRDGQAIEASYSAENGDPTADGVDEPLCTGLPVFGHGHGLCQWGSQRWALAGRDENWMVEHYYPGAVVENVSGTGRVAPPPLLSPEGGATVTEGPVELAAELPSGGRRLHFRICADDFYDDARCLDDGAGLVGYEPEAGVTQITVNLSPGTWIWSARAIGSDETMSWSDYAPQRRIVVNPAPVSAPRLLAPGDGATLTEGSVELAAELPADARRLYFRVCTDFYDDATCLDDGAGLVGYEPEPGVTHITIDLGPATWVWSAAAIGSDETAGWSHYAPLRRIVVSTDACSEEICNEIDDDCDGAVDEGNPGGGASCGTDTGACAAGSLACRAGTLVCLGGVDPVPETCNGADDDCDGTTDEGTCGSTTAPNLIANGDCEDTTDVLEPSGWVGGGWSIYRHDPSAPYGACAFTSGGAAEATSYVSCRIDSSGVDWQFALHQAGLPITAGTTYDLTFAARAETDGRRLQLTVQEHFGGTPLGVGLPASVSLTRTWAYYTIRFTANVTDPDGKLAIFLLQGPGRVDLDVIALRAVP
ncbi:MAG: SpoIID/LytB domain-containing protein [Sandaracinaceae bacterium]